MKKILCVVVLTVFVLSSAIAAIACGGKTTEPIPAPAPAPAPAPTPAPSPAPAPVPTNGVVEVEVEINENGLVPAEVTIPVGGRVVWVNKSDRRWWISSPTKYPDTGVIPITVRMGFTFDKPGEYEYYDLYHKEITGKVIVK